MRFSKPRSSDEKEILLFVGFKRVCKFLERLEAVERALTVRAGVIIEREILKALILRKLSETADF